MAYQLDKLGAAGPHHIKLRFKVSTTVFCDHDLIDSVNIKHPLQRDLGNDFMLGQLNEAIQYQQVDGAGGGATDISITIEYDIE